MSRAAAIGRLGTAIGVLALIVWWVGAGPFIDGLRLVDARTLAVGAAMGAVTTVCCAWRWQVVGRQLGLRLSLADAVAGCYRSVFLNSTLPGGVVGDVHRALRHGRASGDLSGGARSVAWDRTSGQVVQVCLTLAVLLVLPSPVHDAAPYLLAVVGVVAFVLVGVALTRTRRDSRAARVVTAVRADVRSLAGARAWPVIVASSAVVVVGHAIAFVVAARAAGVSAPMSTLLPITLLVLAAMTVPVSFAGWGLREGAAAWAFGTAGIGASAGVTTAVIYGVMSLVGSLPGALVLLAGWRGLIARPQREALHG